MEQPYSEYDIHHHNQNYDYDHLLFPLFADLGSTPSFTATTPYFESRLLEALAKREHLLLQSLLEKGAVSFTRLRIVYQNALYYKERDILFFLQGYDIPNGLVEVVLAGSTQQIMKLLLLENFVPLQKVGIVVDSLYRPFKESSHAPRPCSTRR